MSNAATPNQAKSLYQEPKNKLCEKICLNVHTFGSLAESIGRGKEQVKNKAQVGIVFNNVENLCKN